MHNFDLDPHSRCWFADPAKNGLLRLRNIIVCCGSVPSRGGEGEWRPVKINLSFNLIYTQPHLARLGRGLKWCSFHQMLSPAGSTRSWSRRCSCWCPTPPSSWPRCSGSPASWPSYSAASLRYTVTTHCYCVLLLFVVLYYQCRCRLTTHSTTCPESRNSPPNISSTCSTLWQKISYFPI